MESNICERGINIHFYPMVDTRWHKLTGKYIRKIGKKTVFIAQDGSRWDLNCFKFMDFLSTYIKADWDVECSGLFDDIIMSPYTDLIHNLPLFGKHTNVYEINNRRRYSAFGIYQREYEISFKDIKKSESCVGFSKHHILDVLEKIANCKIKTVYAIYSEGNKVIDGKRRASWENKFSNMNDDDSFQSIFDYELVEGTVGKDGKTYCNKVIIKFSSQLGAIFLHNVFSTGYCRIDKSLYSLSKNAQILYRKRYLPYTTAATKVVLNHDILFHMLGLNVKNVTIAKRTFNNVIEELVDSKMIKIVGKTNKDSIITSKIFTKKVDSID